MGVLMSEPSDPSGPAEVDTPAVPREIRPEDATSTLPIYLEITREHIIRLVEVLLDQPNSAMQIRLSIHELEHALSYDAISYV